MKTPRNAERIKNIIIGISEAVKEAKAWRGIWAKAESRQLLSNVDGSAAALPHHWRFDIMSNRRSYQGHNTNAETGAHPHAVNEKRIHGCFSRSCVRHGFTRR
jgi:hypothetical protein